MHPTLNVKLNWTKMAFVFVANKMHCAYYNTNHEEGAKEHGRGAHARSYRVGKGTRGLEDTPKTKDIMVTSKQSGLWQKA